MFVFLCTLFFPSIAGASKPEELVVFDNFDSGGMDYGSEDKMVDYSLLAIDKKMDLPSSFTICSSVHVNFMISNIYFYQLYKDDGTPWFNLNIRSQRDLNRFQEDVHLRYYKEFDIQPTQHPVPIEPNGATPLVRGQSVRVDTCPGSFVRGNSCPGEHLCGEHLSGWTHQTVRSC